MLADVFIYCNNRKYVRILNQMNVLNFIFFTFDIIYFLTTMKRGTFHHFLTIVAIFLFHAPSLVKSQESPEQLFREAVAQWQSSHKQNYESFHKLANQLSQRFQTSSSGIQAASSRLEIIGAMEESILIIERYIYQEQQGRDDPLRDATLSILYTQYAMSLQALTDQECHSLALDPHTLLIGADTITSISVPSAELCIENAENSFRNAATLDATNVQAEEFLSKINSEPVHKRKPTEFVAELFDSFADSFDEKLLQNLEYRVPSLVGELVQSQSKLYKNALDAGCGTGLAGRYLRPHVEKLIVGVDASQKMLDIAKACTFTKGCGLNKDDIIDHEEGKDRPLYDDLFAMDLEAMTLETILPSDKNGFDLIIAADVLVYFGSLEDIFQTFANISSPKSTLIFSCEKASNNEAPLGYRLLPSGRFAHTKDHAMNVAHNAGFELMEYQDIVPRMEKGEPVKGHLFMFQFNGEKGNDGKDEF